MSIRKSLPSFSFILIAVLLVSPYIACSSGGGGGGGGGDAPTVPDLWVDIDNDTDATIGNEGDGSTADPYDGINYALSFAAADDIVGVADGTYEELVVMVEGVDLLGGYDSSFNTRDPDLNTTIIDGGGLGNVVTGANDATIDGFVITDSGSAGVLLDGVNTTVTNNVIVENEVGVGLYGSNATVSNNYIADAYAGIVALNAGASEMTFPIITNNIVYYNFFAAMYLLAESTYPIAPTISNNVVVYNGRALVGYVGDYGDLLAPTISNNEIYYSVFGASGINFYVYNEGQIHADVISNDIRWHADGGIRGAVFNGYDYPSYTNFPSLSLVAHSNDIYANGSDSYFGGGISLVTYGYYDYPGYSSIDSSISNNIIHNNEGPGILSLASIELDYESYYFTPAASTITSVISNNIISTNDGPGVVAAGGFFAGAAGGTFVNDELVNNLIIGNGGDYGTGVIVFAAEYYGTNSASVHSVNDVIIGNRGNGITAVAYSGSDYGVSGAMVTIDNSIVRDNDDGDLYSYYYPVGPEMTGFNTNFSNIGDGDSNGNGYSGDPGDLINGNISEDPLFVNTPILFDWTTGSGTTVTAAVADGDGDYDVNDVIEFNDDGVARTVTATSPTSITFTPAFWSSTGTNEHIRNFGPGGSVNENLSLSVGSPSIDAGNPLPRYDDTDGTRNDQGLMGGMLGGNPGPSGVVGIDPALGDPGPDWF